MKRSRDFWGDLENYTWKMMDRVSPALVPLGMGIIGMVMISSLITTRSSVVGARELGDVILRATRAGDYRLADAMYRQYIVSSIEYRVSGAGTELEDLVYPERVVEREIEKYEELLLTYPGSRDIYLLLAKLYREIGNNERSNEYLENARKLDPNNEIFR